MNAYAAVDAWIKDRTAIIVAGLNSISWKQTGIKIWIGICSSYWIDKKIFVQEKQLFKNFCQKQNEWDIYISVKVMAASWSMWCRLWAPLTDVKYGLCGSINAEGDIYIYEIIYLCIYML